MMIKGGTFVKCSYCKRKWRIRLRGEKKFRRHRKHNVSCWDWKIQEWES